MVSFRGRDSVVFLAQPLRNLCRYCLEAGNNYVAVMSATKDRGDRENEKVELLLESNRSFINLFRNLCYSGHRIWRTARQPLQGSV